MNRNWSVWAAVVLSVPASAFGENVGTVSQGVVKAGAVAIMNGHASAAVTFNLMDPPSGRWEAKTLNPRQIQTFQLKAAECEFLVRVEGKDPVRYKLAPERRYVMYWDEGRGLWDLYEDKRD